MKVVIILFLFCIAMLWAAIKANEITCYKSWKDSGMAVRWSLIAECQIETQPNVWIPAKNYRGVE